MIDGCCCDGPVPLAEKTSIDVTAARIACFDVASDGGS